MFLSPWNPDGEGGGGRGLGSRGGFAGFIEAFEAKRRSLAERRWGWSPGFWPRLSRRSPPSSLWPPTPRSRPLPLLCAAFGPTASSRPGARDPPVVGPAAAGSGVGLAGRPPARARVLPRSRPALGPLAQRERKGPEVSPPSAPRASASLGPRRPPPPDPAPTPLNHQPPPPTQTHPPPQSLPPRRSVAQVKGPLVVVRRYKSLTTGKLTCPIH